MSPKFLCILCMFPFQVLAQSLNTTILNSTGMALNSSSGYNLTYSVGELASIAQFTSNNNFTLNTGFLQTFTPLVTALNDIAFFEGASVSIYPNPTRLFIQIQANFNKIGQVQFQLVDAESKIKYSSESFMIFNQFNKQVDISDFVSGVYYLRIQIQPNYGQSRIGIYKIVKL